MEAEEAESSVIPELTINNDLGEQEADMVPEPIVAGSAEGATNTEHLEINAVSGTASEDSAESATTTGAGIETFDGQLNGDYDNQDIVAVPELVTTKPEKWAAEVVESEFKATCGSEQPHNVVSKSEKAIEQPNEATFIASTNDCMKVIIKKEVVSSDDDDDYDDELLVADEDQELVGTASCSNAVGTEFRIKTEEIDIKDEVVKRIFECSKCQKTFYLECLYLLHMIGHDGTRPLCCSLCTFKCRKKFRMLSHLRRHTGEKKIVCKICYDYYYYWEISEHFQNCPKPKPYNCNECEYSTGKKYKYLRHVRLHTGERPYKCLRCESYFIDTVARRKHYKTHSKEKPYECYICRKRFKQSTARERHIIAFCDKKCPKCDYICVNCKDYYVHIRECHTHTKLRLNMDRMFREQTKYITAMEQQYGVATDQQIGYDLPQDVKCEMATDTDDLRTVMYLNLA